MPKARILCAKVRGQYQATREDEATYRLGTEFADAILAEIMSLIDSSVAVKKYSLIVRFYEMVRAEVTISDPHVRDLAREVAEAAVYRALDDAGFKLTLWPAGQLLVQWYRA